MKLDQLNPRERLFVMYGLLCVSLAMLWFVLLAPAIQTVRNAPELQAIVADKASQVLLAASELDALRGTRSKVQVRDEDLQVRFQNMLQTENLQEQTSMSRTEEGDLRIEFKQASAAAVLALLANIESLANISLLQVELQKEDAGRVNGYLSLIAKPPINKAR